MPDPRDRYEGKSDLDAGDLAAIRMAMEGLRESEPPIGQSGGFSPRFADLESWVNEFFVLTFGRSGGQIRWCASWWDHAEAVLRLEALWRTWEVAALDPVRGMADWIRDHLDPNLAILLDPSGPFAECDGERHTRAAILPVIAPPPGWWSGPQHWWEVLTEDDR